MIANLLNYIVWDPDPILAHLGPMTIRYYSTCWMIGLLLGYLLMSKLYKQQGLSDEKFSPLFLYIFINILIGGRLGHCIFYQPEYDFGSWQGFLEIFMPWKGGLASHGGTIVLFFAMLWFAHHYGRKNGFDFVWLLDHLCIAVAFAATFIRLGNLMNSEIYGDVTTLPWGFIFDLRGETEPKHPTQLYEALSYFILGIGLMYLYKFKLDKVYRGTFIGIFFIVCFGMRFLIEFIKEPQVAFEDNMILNMGQLLSIPFILLGVGFLIYAYIKKQPAEAVHTLKKR